MTPDAPAGALVRRAPAKLNLALHVTGRRPDGYHLLDTIAAFADAGDTVAASAADDLSIAIDGPFASHAPAGPDNLVLRAASLLRREAGVERGAAIRLSKRLPAGAGIGGGSADAAAVLLLLNDLWGLAVPLAGLAQLGQALGADIPMCLHARALRARGIGEVIEPLERWPDLPVVLAWPGVSVSTVRVYAELASRDNPPLATPPPLASPDEAAEWLRRQRNDLQPPAEVAAPVISDVLERLRETPGCLLARMSGSGSACFGIYGTPAASHAAAATLRQADPGWWVEAATAR